MEILIGNYGNLYYLNTSMWEWNKLIRNNTGFRDALDVSLRESPDSNLIMVKNCHIIIVIISIVILYSTSTETLLH